MLGQNGGRWRRAGGEPSLPGVEQAPLEAAGELLSMAAPRMYPGADSGLTVSDEDRLDAELLASVRG